MHGRTLRPGCESSRPTRGNTPLFGPGRNRGRTRGWPPYQLPWGLGPNYSNVGACTVTPFGRAQRARGVLVVTLPCSAWAGATGVLEVGHPAIIGGQAPTAPKGASGEAYRARHEPGTVGDTREPGEAKAEEDEGDAAAPPAAHRPRPAPGSSAPSQVSLMRHRAQRCAVCKACTGKHDAARARLPPRLRGRGQLGAKTAAAAVATAAGGAVAGPGAPTARSEFPCCGYGPS